MRGNFRTILLLGAALFMLIPAAVAAQTSVAVELDEWTVTAQPASAPEGAVTFEAANTGDAPHELVVIRTDLASGELPMDGDVVDLGQLDVAAAIDPMPGGESGMLNADLQAGAHVLICNVAGHYELGMHTGFEVTAAEDPDPATPEPDDDAEPADPEPEPAAPDPAVTGTGGVAPGGTPLLATVLILGLALSIVGSGRILVARGARSRQ